MIPAYLEERDEDETPTIYRRGAIVPRTSRIARPWRMAWIVGRNQTISHRRQRTNFHAHVNYAMQFMYCGDDDYYYEKARDQFARRYSDQRKLRLARRTDGCISYDGGIPRAWPE